MPRTPLTHCPDCGYSLHGLPARHRCPECGFAYDEATRVWRPKKPFIGMWTLIFALCVSACSLVENFVISRFAKSQWIPGWIHAILLPLLFIVVVVQFSRLVRHRRACRAGVFLAVTPTGVAFRTTRAAGAVAWRDIERAEAGKNLARMFTANEQNALLTLRQAFSDPVLNSLFDAQDRDQLAHCANGILRQRRADAKDVAGIA